MAVDKGSLDYKIRVTDQFTKPIQRFRQELLKARNTANQVKQDLAGVSASIDRLGRTTARAGASTVKLTKEQREHWKAVREGAKTAATAERLRARARKDQGAEAARQAKEIARVARDSEKATNKAAKAKIAADKAAAAAAARAVREQKRLNRELNKTGKRANGLVLTFKRLAGVFIGFQAIRFGVEGIRESIAAGIRFNSILEDSRVGVAGIIATLADVTDGEGKMVEGAEKFNIALGLADSTLEKIRRRSLATTATFPQLIEAFQAGVAPGLEAGLSLDEIVTVTERVSQAAAGLRIQQNQLNEEIRSLLRGTAQARTSLVATILFGGAENANKRIKEAREVGNVFEVINERLKILGIAANETQRTFTGTLARLKGVLEFSAGRGSIIFFQTLKTIMNEVSDVFVTTSRTAEGFIENVTPKESTVILLGQVFGTLTAITNQVRSFLAQLTGGEVAAFVVTIGAAFEIVSALLIGALDGVIRAVGLIGAFLNAVGFALSDLDLSDLVEMVSLFTTILVLSSLIKTSILAWGIATKLFVKTTLALTAVWNIMLGPIGKVLLGIGRIPPFLFTAIGAVGLLALAFGKVASEILGIPLELNDLPGLIGIIMEQVITKGIGVASLIATAISSRVQQAFNSLVTAAGNAFKQLKALVDLNLGGSEALQRVKDADVAFEIAQANTELKRKNAKLELAVTEEKKIQAQIDTDANKKAGERVALLEAEITKRAEISKLLLAEQEAAAKGIGALDTKTKGFLETLTAPVSDLITGLLGADIVDVESIASEIAAAIEKGKQEGSASPTKILGPLAAELTEGFKNMADNYKNALSIMKGLTQQFASFASVEIVEALDPNKSEDGPSANERFKAFLDQIGKLIIQKLVELAIAKAILSIASFSGGGEVGASRGGQIGFDDGGTVPGGRHEARQYRPAQVAMSDTVPAWLTPGEFVTPVRSVMKYGADLLEGMRTGAIDAAALREAAGLTNRRKSVKKVRARGYAEGGAIDAATAGAKNIQQQQNETSFAGGPQMNPALMVSDDQTMERLMAGGQRAFRNWAENDKEFFRGIVRE